jgi:hypothetical protein
MPLTLRDFGHRMPLTLLPCRTSECIPAVHSVMN